MRLPVIIAFLFSGATVLGQDLQKEINTQVWEPFISSFSNFQSEAFLSVHSKDVVRSPRDAKRIFHGQQYLEMQKRGDDRAKKEGRKRSIELRFTERIAENDLAIDVGIYKTTDTDPSGQQQSYYGRFHVVLRKEDGRWKILVDTDSTENNTIGEKDFLAAKPL